MIPLRAGYFRRPIARLPMNHHLPNPEHLFLTKRDFLRRAGMGMGMLAMGGIFGQNGVFGPAGAVAAEQISSTNPLAAKKPSIVQCLDCWSERNIR